MNILNALIGGIFMVDVNQSEAILAKLYTDSQAYAKVLASMPADPEKIAGVSYKTLARKTGKTAMLPIRGTMLADANWVDELFGYISTRKLTAAVHDLAKTADVKTIVLAMDTPGGQVNGIDELVQAVRFAKEAGKVVIAHADLAASAGYWVASQADEIVGSRFSEVGSIGVIMAHTDVSKMLENAGIKQTFISAGKYKSEGYEPLTDDAIAALQARVDSIYESFVSDIAEGRKVSAKDVKANYGQGRVVGANDALKSGMIDRVMSLSDLIGKLVQASPDNSNARAQTAIASLRLKNVR